MNVQGGLPDLSGEGELSSAYYFFEIADADPSGNATTTFTALNPSSGDIFNSDNFIFTGLTPGFKRIRVYDQSTPDSCNLEVVVEVFEGFNIEGPADLCDNRGQLIISKVTGGRDPRIYTNAVSPAPNSSVNPYALYLFEKGDLSLIHI